MKIQSFWTYRVIVWGHILTIACSIFFISFETWCSSIFCAFYRNGEHRGKRYWCWLPIFESKNNLAKVQRFKSLKILKQPMSDVSRQARINVKRSVSFLPHCCSSPAPTNTLRNTVGARKPMFRQNNSIHSVCRRHFHDNTHKKLMLALQWHSLKL